MLHIIRFIILSLVIMLISCQGAKGPMTDAQKSEIKDTLIAKHAEMLKFASSADAEGLFSHFIDNKEAKSSCS